MRRRRRRLRKRKCRCCRRWFLPQPQNAYHQRYCTELSCELDEPEAESVVWQLWFDYTVSR